MKILNMIAATIAVIIITTLLYTINKAGPSRKEKESAVALFEKVISDDIASITIYYYGMERWSIQYKVLIKDKIVIQKILKATKSNLKQKAFSGRYLDRYLVKLVTKSGQAYNFQYWKKSTDIGVEECRNGLKLNHKNRKPYLHYEACGQLALIKEHGITEEEYKKMKYPEDILSFENIALIPIIEKYADTISFHSKSKEYLFKQQAP